MLDPASPALVANVGRKKLHFPRVTSHRYGKDRGKKLACLQACRGEKEEKGEKKEGRGGDAVEKMPSIQTYVTIWLTITAYA